MTAPKVITSLTNDRVKAIRALEMRKVRKETGLFVAEGASLLVTARDNGFVPETLVYQAGTAAKRHRARARDVGAEARAPKFSKSPKPCSPSSHRRTIRRRMLGVFRQRWADPPQPTTVKSSARRGWRSKRCAIPATSAPSSAPPMPSVLPASFSSARAAIPIRTSACARRWARSSRCRWSRWSGAAFLASPRTGAVTSSERTSTGARIFARRSYRGPQLIVMGSEGPGLSADVAAACTRLVKIPMSGRLDSLNLAIATALMLYQIRGPHLKLLTHAHRISSDADCRPRAQRSVLCGAEGRHRAGQDHGCRRYRRRYRTARPDGAQSSARTRCSSTKRPRSRASPPRC